MTSDTHRSMREDAIDRGLALVGYGLLFIAPFFGGVPALIAVILAYARRREAASTVNAHYGFQQRIFWIALLLAVIAAGCALGAVLTVVGGVMQGSFGEVWDTIAFDFSNADFVRISSPLVALGVIAAEAWSLSCLWLMAASAVGFIRLASDRSMGQVARP